MEYNLQKSLESNFIFSSLLSSSHQYPRLSAQPSKDFVTPGVGKLANLYSLYVPLYGSSPPYEIKKVTESADSAQIGAGNVTNEPINEPIINEPDFSQISPLKSSKRKLDDGIAESFLHPKIIKTKTIRLEPPTVKKEIKSQNSLKPALGSGMGNSKSANHKFQFL
jgi:hypothetical protein